MCRKFSEENTTLENQSEILNLNNSINETHRAESLNRIIRQKNVLSAGWHVPVLPASWRLEQKDFKTKSSVGYTASQEGKRLEWRGRDGRRKEKHVWGLNVGPLK